MARAEGEKQRAYLLGLLPREEAVPLEEAYFAEESAFEELALAEEDLIDEYLDEGLGEEERAAFESRLTERPELLARVEARRRLRRALRRRAGAVPARMGRGRVALALAAAAAGIFVTVRFVQERPAMRPVSTSPAAVAPPRDAVIRPPSVPVVLLLGTAVREASRVPTALLTPEIPALRLRLPTVATDTPVDAVVENVDGGIVWRGRGRIVMEESGTPQAEAEIPSSALPAGDYIVRYRGLRDGEEEAFFRVRRQGSGN